MRRCIVILSGGMDSTITLFLAKHRFSEVHAVTFDYGQQHRIELEAAKKVALLAGVMSHEIVNIGGVLESSSPLTSDNKLEEYSDYDSMVSSVGDRIESTFVPMRNLLFLVIAANRAIAKNIRDIGLGICQADTANYPDCTVSFLKSSFKTIRKSLGLKREDGLRTFAPLVTSTKASSVHVARSMPDCWEALAYTHTSYDGLYPPTGKNHANLLRASGFEAAGYPDPLILRAVREGLMELPYTANYTSECTG